jgi:putative (di)nucleoside polyphosphate hydrolase
MTENLYRKAVGLLIINEKLEAFIGKRRDTKAADAWQMPQGGIDEGETPKEAAIRELAEETGITSVEIVAETEQWFRYEIPAYIATKLWGGKYIGQEQKWFLLKFKGKESEINLESYTEERSEFSEWKWCKLEELADHVVFFKRNLYIEILESFRDYLIEIRKNLKKTS